MSLITVGAYRPRHAGTAAVPEGPACYFGRHRREGWTRLRLADGDAGPFLTLFAASVGQEVTW